MTDNQAVPQSLWPRHVSWLTIIFALLAIISFIAISSPDVRRYAVLPMETGVSGVPTQEKAGSNIYYPNPNVPVNDTREFLKVYYSAFMRTRDVQGLTRRVETTIRGYGGRIDQESSSPQYWDVNFSLSPSKN